MSKVIYFDCFSGASGDMIIGSLLDAGLPFPQLQAAIAGLHLEGVRLEAQKVLKNGISATSFRVIEDQPHSHSPAAESVEEHHQHDGHPSEHEHHPDHEHDHIHHPEAEENHEHHPENPAPHQHRGLKEISTIIQAADLSTAVKKRSLEIFRKLAEVEAGIHGVTPEEVHFHELGAVDTIVDIVGTLFGLETLGIAECYSSPLVTGNGTVKTAHGILPVPAPATLSILVQANAPVISAPPSDNPPGELLTPTGAVLITTLAQFRRPDIQVTAGGYGAGFKSFANWPNVLRVWIGEKSAAPAQDDMVLLETNIDDMNPQVYGYLMEKLLAEKAADVWFTPIQMKKNRPAIMLSVLAASHLENKMTEIILTETTTLGIRVRPVHRHTAQREIRPFDSSLGKVYIKIKTIEGRVLEIAPEYDDIRSIAKERGLPFIEAQRTITEEARRALL